MNGRQPKYSHPGRQINIGSGPFFVPAGIILEIREHYFCANRNIQNKQRSRHPATLATFLITFGRDPPATGSSNTAILRTPVRPLKSRQHGARINQRPPGARLSANTGSSIR
jgi:hypothetical protein